MLSISEFSEMCCLSAQTLRFYHAEGLLVPAGVDEQTGYRSYTFDQVEQAMLITVLRGTGMSVKLVRRALDEPGAAAAMVEDHHSEVRRQRQLQDEAFSDAREFFDSSPQPRRRSVPGVTVVSKAVAGPPSGRGAYDWDEADAAATIAIQDLIATVQSCGAVVSGTPWRSWAADTPEQKKQALTAEGPHWLVKVPVLADEQSVAALRCDVEVQVFEAREELSIFVPGRSSMAKFATACSRLVAYPLGDSFTDMSEMRQVLHDNGVETAMAIRKLEATDRLSEA